MVLFTLHHIKEPMQLDAILVKTGWDHTQTVLQETNPVEVHSQLEKDFLMEEVNKPAHEYLHEHAAEVATRNYELLREAVRDADRCQDKTIQKDAQLWEQRHHKERQQRQTDLELHAHNRWKDKEHVAAAAAAKECDKEAMPPPDIPPCLPPPEKTLTMTMPPSSVPSVPVSICCPEATPPQTLWSSEGPGPTGLSSSSPSPTKAVNSLDSADVVDPLQQFWKHYLPDEAEMDEPDEDSPAISKMELEYAGVPSTCEDWYREDYGYIPTYHTIPSPTRDDEDNDGMLEGSTVEVSPDTEVALLRIEDISGNQPAGQQAMDAQQLRVKQPCTLN